MGFKDIARTALITTAKTIGLDDLFLTGQEHIAFSFGNREGAAGVDNAYSSSWIAYSCIAKQAKDIAGAPLLILRDPEDPDSIVPDYDKLARLIYNPHPGLTHNQFVQFIATMLRLRGAFFVDFDDPDRPTRMIPWRDPRYWKPVVNDQEELVVGWEYQKGQKHFERMPSDVIVGRQIDPTDPWGWQSPLAAAANPLKIDRDGDRLNAKTIGQGGEGGTLYKMSGDLSPQKYDQLIQRLNSRQNEEGEPPRPAILTNGLDVVDPKFTKQDLQILSQQERSAEKICAVYGMSPALLFRDDTPNKATFETRRRIYWAETLVPIMRHIEDAFDQWTVSRFGLYCRFDLTSVPAMREDLSDQVKVAKILHTMNIPIAAIDAFLGLGLDLDLIPGADEALVSAALVPASVVLDADYMPPAPVEAEPEAKMPSKSMQPQAPAPFKVTNKMIRERHKDAVAVIARGKARTALEVRAEKAYRGTMVKWRAKVAKLADAADGDVGTLRTALYGIREELGNAMADCLAPMHRDAAVEGALSILDLLSAERFYGTENENIFRKIPELSPESVYAIQARRDYMNDFKSRAIIEEIFDEIAAIPAEETENTASSIARIVRNRFNKEINRANMIGRTEVGTAFNASRFGQMKSSQIETHEWLTAGDEMVRGENPDDLFSHVQCDGEKREVGRTFPTGLEYPQENGGEPGNVINCRCLTIPVVQE